MGGLERKSEDEGGGIVSGRDPHREKPNMNYCLICIACCAAASDALKSPSFV